MVVQTESKNARSPSQLALYAVRYGEEYFDRCFRGGKLQKQTADLADILWSMGNPYRLPRSEIRAEETKIPADTCGLTASGHSDGRRFSDRVILAGRPLCWSAQIPRLANSSFKSATRTVVFDSKMDVNLLTAVAGGLEGHID